MRFHRSARFMIAAAAASAVMMVAGGAHASELDGAYATSDDAPVDVWTSAGGVVNALVGPRSCTISASAPVVSANQVAGSGSVRCNQIWDKLTLTVCVQWRQAFVNEDATWQDAGCAPTKAALSTDRLNSTATGPCAPGAVRYRTKVVAEGFDADSSDPAFTGMIVSSWVLKDCFLG